MVSCYDSQTKSRIMSKIIVVVKVSFPPGSLKNSRVVVIAVSFVFYSVGLSCELALLHAHLAHTCRAPLSMKLVAGLKCVDIVLAHFVIISVVDLHEICFHVHW